MIGIISWFEITQSDGGEGDEAVVEGVEICPFGLDGGEDPGRDGEDEDEKRGENDADVDQLEMGMIC